MTTMDIGTTDEEEIVRQTSTDSLAQKTITREKTGNMVQVVEFILGDELFAINLSDTREVIVGTEITPVPNSPDFVRGLIDLRGIITTIIDLKKMMKIDQKKTITKKERIIVLDNEIADKRIGILVDDVFSVTTYSKGDIDMSERGSDHNGRDIIGVIRRQKIQGDEKGKLILWLDIRKMVHQKGKEL